MIDDFDLAMLPLFKAAIGSYAKFGCPVTAGHALATARFPHGSWSNYDLTRLGQHLSGARFYLDRAGWARF